MATIKNFEDLEIWQLSKEFDKKVYKQVLLKISDENISLKNQLNKSSGSIMDNIAEGFGRGGNKELRQFLAIAKGSVNEAKSQLYRVVSRELLPEIEIKQLLEQAELINKKIGSFMHYLTQTEMKGVKYLKEPYETYQNFNSEDMNRDI